MKFKKSIFATLAATLFIGAPTGIFFGFRNDQRASRVEPLPVEDKQLTLHTNPFDYYNQEAFNHKWIFENDNGYTGNKIILPFGSGYKNKEQNTIRLYEVMNDDGVDTPPSVIEDKYIDIEIFQKPKNIDQYSMEQYEIELSIIVDSTHASNAYKDPKIFIETLGFEDCSSWASVPEKYMYEETKLYASSSTKLLGTSIGNNKYEYNIDLMNTSWYGIRVENYSKKEFSSYFTSFNKNGTYVPDLFFESTSSFFTPTLKYDINKSDGNTLNSRNYLYDKYGRQLGLSRSLIHDGESTAYGRLTETIDFREPYIHNNYHISKMKQNYEDKPIKNEYWNMLNYVPNIDNKWKIILDINFDLYLHIVEMDEFDKWLNGGLWDGKEVDFYMLLNEPESAKFLKRIYFNELISGTYTFEKVNDKITSKFKPYKANPKLRTKINDGQGNVIDIYETKDMDISASLDEDGYLSILLNDFITLNENQVIAQVGDDIAGNSKMTVENDLDNDGIFSADEKLELIVQEGSPSVSEPVWHWGGKRYSNPAPSKFITEWNNNGPDYWNFYAITPIQLTGIVLTATLLTISIYWTIDNLLDVEKRESLIKKFNKLKK